MLRTRLIISVILSWLNAFGSTDYSSLVNSLRSTQSNFELSAGNTETNGNHSGAIVSFNTKRGEQSVFQVMDSMYSCTPDGYCGDEDNGKTLIINADNISDKNLYIDTVKFNGKKYNKNYSNRSDLRNGGVIELKMSDIPNMKRRTTESAYPYSFSKELH